MRRDDGDRSLRRQVGRCWIASTPPCIDPSGHPDYRPAAKSVNEMLLIGNRGMDAVVFGKNGRL